MNLFHDVFTYAFRGKGKYVLFSCVAITMLADLVSFAPVLGLVAFILITGYFCAVYYQLMEASATGAVEAPDFPDTADIVQDIMRPLFQVIAVLMVSFGPLIVHVFTYTEWPNIPVIIACAVFGVVYFPMAMLAVVVLGYTRAVSPHIVIPAIFRAGWIYWLAVGMLVFLYVLIHFLGMIMPDVIVLEYVGQAIIGIYAMMTNARILGIIYRERQEQLRWV